MSRAPKPIGGIWARATACLMAGVSFFVADSAGAADSGAARASVLQHRVVDAADELSRDPALANVPEYEIRDNIEFVAGNLIFATVHEVGHMLISEMGLPVLGREEDAADA